MFQQNTKITFHIEFAQKGTPHNELSEWRIAGGGPENYERFDELLPAIERINRYKNADPSDTEIYRIIKVTTTKQYEIQLY